jgi:hypothetical protein
VTNNTRPLRDNPDLLRHDIDSGRTGDKVAFPDPAAVPLGTDEEAAGTPVSAHAAAMARSAETSRHPTAMRHNRPGAGWVVTAALLVLAMVVVGGLLLL